MKTKDLGSIIAVSVSAREVDAFKATWPCSGLPSRAITFQFEKRNGDLVDIFPSSIDGPAAVALSQDAWDFFQRAANQKAKENALLAQLEERMEIGSGNAPELCENERPLGLSN